jgi:hypothetical protein
LALIRAGVGKPNDVFQNDKLKEIDAEWVGLPAAKGWDDQNGRVQCQTAAETLPTSLSGSLAKVSAVAERVDRHGWMAGHPIRYPTKSCFGFWWQRNCCHVIDCRPAIKSPDTMVV